MKNYNGKKDKIESKHQQQQKKIQKKKNKETKEEKINSFICCFAVLLFDNESVVEIMQAIQCA